MAGWFDREVPVGGMFVGAVARDLSLDTDRLFTLGLEAGVCATPSSVFDPTGRDRSGLRLNFTLNPPDRLAEPPDRLAEPPDRLAEGVQRLATALRTMSRKG